MQNRIFFQFRSIALLALLVLLLGACDNPERRAVASQAWQKIDQGALLIDVRTAKEFSRGHIEGALNIPYENTAELIKAIGTNKTRPVVLYCRSGRRAGVAQQALAREGYTAVFNGLGLRDLKAARADTSD